MEKGRTLLLELPIRYNGSTRKGGITMAKKETYFNVTIRDAAEADHRDIVAINNSEIHYTNFFDEKRVRFLDSLSVYHRVAVFRGQTAAFILAMKDHVPYENENYSWFSERYDRFLYIDRIVVERAFQGLNIGSLLYRNLFQYARRENIPVITCEIMLLPPNERSLAFHAKRGFKQVGTRSFDSGRKKYSMQAASTTGNPG